MSIDTRGQSVPGALSGKQEYPVKSAIIVTRGSVYYESESFHTRLGKLPNPSGTLHYCTFSHYCVLWRLLDNGKEKKSGNPTVQSHTQFFDAGSSSCVK